MRFAQLCSSAFIISLCCASQTPAQVTDDQAKQMLADQAAKAGSNTSSCNGLATRLMWTNVNTAYARQSYVEAFRYGNTNAPLLAKCALKNDKDLAKWAFQVGRILAVVAVSARKGAFGGDFVSYTRDAMPLLRYAQDHNVAHADDSLKALADAKLTQYAPEETTAATSSTNPPPSAPAASTSAASGRLENGSISDQQVREILALEASKPNAQATGCRRITFEGPSTPDDVVSGQLQRGEYLQAQGYANNSAGIYAICERNFGKPSDRPQWAFKVGMMLAVQYVAAKKLDIIQETDLAAAKRAVVLLTYAQQHAVPKAGEYLELLPGGSESVSSPSPNAATAGSGRSHRLVDVTAFDISGVRLYMTINETVAALKKHYGPGIRIDGPSTLVPDQVQVDDGPFRLTVDFVPSFPPNPAHPENATYIRLNPDPALHATRADGDQLREAAMQKFGPPTLQPDKDLLKNEIHPPYEWCSTIIGSGTMLGNRELAYCDRGKPWLRFTGALELGDSGLAGKMEELRQKTPTKAKPKI